MCVWVCICVYTYIWGINVFSFWYVIYRDVYEYMITRQRDKGRSRSGKGESFSMQQLEMARDEYDEESTLFVFRLKSLKQGQSRSLLTQAARHHAAQVFLLYSLTSSSLNVVILHVA